MLLIIDNYDSFTFNLVQYFRELGQEVKIFRNDEISLAEIESLNPQYLVISPGPSTPDESGISLKVVDYFSGKIPILGVCPGLQAIAQSFGGKIISAPKVVHGYTSKICHLGQGIFEDLPSPFNATRYHSLVVDSNLLNDCFEITAWVEETELEDCQSGEKQVDEENQPRGDSLLIMGLKHKTLAVEGIQFHPESILTEQGHQLLNNFIQRYQ